MEHALLLTLLLVPVGGIAVGLVAVLLHRRDMAAVRRADEAAADHASRPGNGTPTGA